jgi:hypothetical protein
MSEFCCSKISFFTTKWYFLSSYSFWDYFNIEVDIGATQQLDKELETEKQTIVEIDSRVAELKETTAQENIEVKDKIRNLFDVLFAEENGDRYDTTEYYPLPLPTHFLLKSLKPVCIE